MRQLVSAFAVAVVLAVSGTVGAAAQNADILEPEPQGPSAVLYCYPPTDPSSNGGAPASRQVVPVTAGSIWHQDTVQRGYNCFPERQ